MTVGYAIAYRLGLTPWEQAGRDAAVQFDALLDREQADRPSLGRALDIGCGTGDHAVNLARRGWDVTAVDLVPRALDAARAKAAAAGVPLRCVRADVTDMADVIGRDFTFVLDVGCFHGLKAKERPRYAEQVQLVSGPGSTMLMLAFAPGRRTPGPLPRGASPQELRDTFEGWELVADDAADTSCMSAPLKRTAPHFFRLRRQN